MRLSLAQAKTTKKPKMAVMLPRFVRCRCRPGYYGRSCELKEEERGEGGEPVCSAYQLVYVSMFLMNGPDEYLKDATARYRRSKKLFRNKLRNWNINKQGKFNNFFNCEVFHNFHKLYD